MAIRQIIKSWGIDISDNEYIPEDLLQKYSSKCYFVDFFPEAVKEEFSHKLDQIEEKIYKLIYSRIYNVIIKLWVCDNVYFESELLYAKSTHIFNKKTLLKSLAVNRIEKENQIKRLFSLSEKNVIDLLLLFENLRIIIIPSFLGFFVFIENDSSFSFINQMFIIEGLYMRKADI